MANIGKIIGKNKKISYRVRVRIKGCPTQTATFDSFTKAKEWARIMENQIIDGDFDTLIKAKRNTVSDLINRYFKTILPELKPKTAKDFKMQLLWWKSVLGDTALSDVTPAVLLEYREKLKERKGKKENKTLSNATLNRYMSVLSIVWNYGYKEWEWINENPFLKIHKLKENNERVKYLSDDEREKLLEECKKARNPYLYPAVVLAISTGARKMEILNLKWTDVNFEQKHAILQKTKNGEKRSIPLVNIAFDIMTNLYKNRKSNVWVFPSNDNTKPFDIKRSWETARKNAGLEDFHFHDLRHTCASYLAMNGATLNEIADVLGHKTFQMVKRYAHLSDAHKQSVVADMNSKIFG